MQDSASWSMATGALAASACTPTPMVKARADATRWYCMSTSRSQARGGIAARLWSDSRTLRPARRRVKAECVAVARHGQLSHRRTMGAVSARRRRQEASASPADGASPLLSRPPDTLPLRPFAVGLLATAFALLNRVLFVMATPDSQWAHSAFFVGDAHVWLQAAAAVREGRPFELGLPLRPPGTAYLLA